MSKQIRIEESPPIPTPTPRRGEILEVKPKESDRGWWVDYGGREILVLYREASVVEVFDPQACKNVNHRPTCPGGLPSCRREGRLMPCEACQEWQDKESRKERLANLACSEVDGIPGACSSHSEGRNT